jgi:hypothetical protein
LYELRTYFKEKIGNEKQPVLSTSPDYEEQERKESDDSNSVDPKIRPIPLLA